MTALGVNMSDRDPKTGWADIKPTRRTQTELDILALCAWKLAAKMVDDNQSWEAIQSVQAIAQEIENLSPEQPCPDELKKKIEYYVRTYGK